jgi:DUF218 domain
MIAGADFIRYLLSAGGVILVFLGCAVWLAFRSGSRTVRRIVVAKAVAFTLLSTFGIEYGFSRLLIGSLQPFSATDIVAGRRTALVILGSGSFTVEDWSGHTFSVPDPAGAARVLEAVRVFRLIDPALVIASGGKPHPEKLEAPSGDTMHDALVGLGVPTARILVETLSTTTRDEAVLIAPMLRAHQIEQVVLVTSDVHMRRSLGTFRAAGITTIPAMARELDPNVSWIDWLLPSNNGLWVAAGNVHEVLGIVYYSLRGWRK